VHIWVIREGLKCTDTLAREPGKRAGKALVIWTWDRREPVVTREGWQGVRGPWLVVVMNEPEGEAVVALGETNGESYQIPKMPLARN
jgi:hypothetical protein